MIAPMSELLAIRYDFDVVWDFLFDPIVLEALWETMKISTLAMVGGVVLGIVLAVMRVSRNPVASTASGLYVWFWRGTPVILQLLMFFFGLKQVIDEDIFRDNWTRFRAAVVIFAFNEAAYMAEIGRAGILSVDPGQMDAAKSLGMTNLQAMRRIILPQAIRVMIPPTGNEFIALLKNTSVLFAIGIVELTNAARIQAARNFKIMELYSVAAFWYLMIVTVFSIGQAELERRFAAGERDQPQTLFSRMTRVVGASRRGEGKF